MKDFDNSKENLNMPKEKNKDIFNILCELKKLVELEALEKDQCKYNFNYI